METIIVYLDDADYAQPLLHSMSQAPRAADIHWVVVACAPRITHRVSKWVSNRSRENWRTKWADKLFAATLPALQGSVGKLTPLLARGPLAEVVDQVREELGASPQIVDLRRPKLEAQSTSVGSMVNPLSGKSKLQAGRSLPGLLAALAGCMGFVAEQALL